MTDDLSVLAGRAAYYRRIATAVRTLVSRMKSVEAREELSALAREYEVLAGYVDSALPYESRFGLGPGSPRLTWTAVPNTSAAAKDTP